MSQINYNIIMNLMNKPNHIRGLAKDLKTNQTTIARKMRELSEANTVDFKIDGKNKTYFLKKTIETKEHLIIAEHYELLKTIKKYPILRNIIEQIKKEKSINMAILFGSYTKGLANKNSDIDLYLDTKDKKIKEKIENINSKLNIKTGKYNKNSILIKEIQKNHVIIKGAEIYYEKNGFFE